MLSVVILNVGMLNVVKLSVVAPYRLRLRQSPLLAKEPRALRRELETILVFTQISMARVVALLAKEKCGKLASVNGALQSLTI
jgi:hypothetical protein